MTNEQLLIITKNHRTLLSQAIEKAESLLPENAEKQTYNRHNNGTYGIIPCVFCSPEKRPEHWRAVPDGFVALNPLYELLNSLDEDIEILANAQTVQTA